MGLSIVATILWFALNIFVVIMWVRLVFDLIASFSRGWRPRGFWLLVAEFAYVVTDPPVKFVRRIIPPIRVGGFALDFAWTIVILIALILSYIVSGFMVG